MNKLLQIGAIGLALAGSLPLQAKLYLPLRHRTGGPVKEDSSSCVAYLPTLSAAPPIKIGDTVSNAQQICGETAGPKLVGKVYDWKQDFKEVEDPTFVGYSVLESSKMGRVAIGFFYSTAE